MKIKLSQFLLLSLAISLLLHCCRKEVFLPDIEGSLVGYVYLFDEFGILLEDQSDVTITALGLDKHKTFTDESGRFEFMNLPAGTYELHFEKAGFGTLKQFGIQHLGGTPTILGLELSLSGWYTLASAFYLYEMQHTEITGLTIENDTIVADLSFAGSEPSYVDLILYFSVESGFSISMAEYIDCCTRLYLKENHKYFGDLYASIMPFEPGQIVFVKAFAITRVGVLQNSRGDISGIDTYFDYINNCTVYPNKGNESAQYSFIFPQ